MSLVNQAKTREILECYEQTGAWADGSILPKHEYESDTRLGRRKDSMVIPGVFRYLIDTLDVLYARNPARTGASTLYTEIFCYDAGQGLSLDSLLKRGIKLGLATGGVYLLMENDANQPRDMESVIKGRLFPWLRMIMPHEVSVLVVDQVGRIVKFGYDFYEYDEKGAMIRRQRVYSADSITVLDTDGKTVSSSAHGLSRVPVVPVIPSEYPLATNVLPPSPTLSLYQKEKSVAISISLLLESIYSQMFAILVISSRDSVENVNLGTGNGLKLGENSTADFIAPPATPIEQIVNTIVSMIKMMQETFLNLITNGSAQSGVAKQLDRQVGTNQLKAYARQMEEIEYEIHELFAEYFPSEPTESFTVDYFKDFDLESIVTYVANAIDMMDSTLGFTDEVKKQVRIELVKKYFAGVDPLTVIKLLSVEANNSGTEPAPAVDLPSNSDPLNDDETDNLDNAQ